MNAYELTKELTKFMTEDEYTDLDKAIFMASNMLRQQADRIAELEKFNKAILKKGGYPHKPLSIEEIEEIYKKVYEEGHSNQVVALGRAIEEAHGIK